MRVWNSLVPLMLAASWIIVLSGCGSRAANKAATVRAAGDPLEITPGADLVLEIKVAEARSEAVNGTLRVASRVEADETRMARVSAPLAGRIVELRAFEGEQVTRGQVLATVYSADLAAAQSTYLKAFSQTRLAERAVARAKQLLDAGVIGEAELQRRESELQQSNADLSAAREQLAVLGFSSDLIQRLETSRILNSTTHILSSIDGMVLERKATIGEMIEAAATVFVIADLSNVWMVADIPEQSAGAIQVGKAVEAEIPALPGEKIEGKLSFVSAIVNRETRTVRARMNLPNPQRKYKPAMLATMTLLDSAERRLLVPVAAVVRDGNEDSVMVQVRPNTFALRRVKLGEEYRNGRVVLEGLREREMIAVEGAFHLNNERKRRLLQGTEGT